MQAYMVLVTSSPEGNRKSTDSHTVWYPEYRKPQPPHPVTHFLQQRKPHLLVVPLPLEVNYHTHHQKNMTVIYVWLTDLHL